MNNLVFVIWMLAWPIVCAVEDYLIHLTGKTFSANAVGFSAIIRLAIWIFIAVRLYQK